ncbi:hypothetical protein [Herbihabitans rhizosphaerae]|uniref:hypothetical protein n=1 Tax=Herbihabitans rhizosphaerae TaxID=1872711 RepID=UPI00102BE0E1|nr:hypothetical protein [Herbihabitans rhizosphaerae]
MALFATIMAAVGLGLSAVSQLPGVKDVAVLPVKDIGGGLFTTGLVILVVDYLISRNLIMAFLADPDAMNRIASPDMVDRIIESGLDSRLNDPVLARDLYTDLREHVIDVDERRYDTHVSITLTPWQNGPAEGEGAMFVATVRWDYRVTGRTGVHRFACVGDAGEYRQLLRDPTVTKVVHMDPRTGLDPGAADVFELVEFTINGVSQRIEHRRRDGGQVFSAESPDVGGGERHVSYTYRALTPRHGHLFYIDIDRPTHGIRADFTHHDCGIRYVNVPDFLGSPRDPWVHRSPETSSTSVISLSHDGWILPKTGITYTWTLHDELRSGGPAGH